MFNRKVTYTISISHTRPPYPDNILFLFTYRARAGPTSKDVETLRDIFTRAFKEAHPDWPIKQVNVDKE